jgi:putative transcriptional regulator
MNLHNNLKETRLKKNFTQEALAGAVGVTRQTIIAIEKEKFVPSVKLALELASALDTPIGKIFWLEKSQGEKS